MDKKDLPRDGSALTSFNQNYYVLDEDGNYVCLKGTGWEPINIADNVAREFDNENLAAVLEKVRKHELSPLAYHMKKHMMDPKALAQYVGCSKWRVKRHLKPEGFNDLDQETKARYATLFNITEEELGRIP